MSPAEANKTESLVIGKLGMKFLALLLGMMAWYLIQDAIRIESVRRQSTLEPKPGKPVSMSVLRLDRLPVTVLGPTGAWEWKVSPAFATVWMEGTEAALERIEKSAVRLFVDGVVMAQDGETALLPVKAHLPAEVRVKVQMEPMRVEVSVKAVGKGEP